MVRSKSAEEEALEAAEELMEKLEASQARERSLRADVERLRESNANFAHEVEELATGLHLAVEQLEHAQRIAEDREKALVEANKVATEQTQMRIKLGNKLEACMLDLERARNERRKALGEVEIMQSMLENNLNEFDAETTQARLSAEREAWIVALDCELEMQNRKIRQQHKRSIQEKFYEEDTEDEQPEESCEEPDGPRKHQSKQDSVGAHVEAKEHAADEPDEKDKDDEVVRKSFLKLETPKVERRRGGEEKSAPKKVEKRLPAKPESLAVDEMHIYPTVVSQASIPCQQEKPIQRAKGETTKTAVENIPPPPIPSKPKSLSEAMMAAKLIADKRGRYSRGDLESKISERSNAVSSRFPAAYIDENSTVFDAVHQKDMLPGVIAPSSPIASKSKLGPLSSTARWQSRLLWDQIEH